VRALVALLIVIPVAAFAQPAPAPAGPPDPVTLADEAKALAAAGKFVEAAAKYREANALEPRPDLLCNIGVAFHKARDLPRAHLYLGQCLVTASSLGAAFLDDVRNVLAAVEARLREGEFAPVDVRVKPDNARFTVSAFGPDDTIVGSRVVWLPFGTHTIAFSAEAHVARTEPVAVKDRTPATVVVTLERAVVVDHPDGGAAAKPAVLRRSRRYAIIASAATVVLAGAAIATYARARQRASDAGAPEITGPAYDRLVGEARDWQHASWGLTAAAVVGAGVTGYLWYRATRSPGTVVEVQPTAGGATVSLSGRF